MNDKDSVIRRIAIMIDARNTCAEHGGNGPWFDTWTERLRAVAVTQLPSGSGFDSGTQIMLDECKPDLIVLRTAFHHMNDHGYCGWTHHTVRVRPSFIYDFRVSVSGPNTRDIKDYIAETFDIALRATYRPATAEEIAANVSREAHDKAEEEKDRTYARKNIALLDAAREAQELNAPIESTKQSDEQP